MGTREGICPLIVQNLHTNQYNKVAAAHDQSHYTAPAPTTSPPNTIISARPIPAPGVSAIAAPGVPLTLELAPDPDADPLLADARDAEDAEDAEAAEDTDAKEESAELATECADDTAEDATELTEFVKDEREAEMDEPGAVAVAEAEVVMVPDVAVLVVGRRDEGGTAGAEIVNAGLLVITSEASVMLTNETTYDPDRITCGITTLNWLLCTFGTVAIAYPPAKVGLPPELKSANVSGLVSEESDDQVMVTLEPGVIDAGTCKSDTATAMAANARAAMA